MNGIFLNSLGYWLNTIVLALPFDLVSLVGRGLFLELNYRIFSLCLFKNTIFLRIIILINNDGFGFFYKTGWLAFLAAHDHIWLFRYRTIIMIRAIRYILIYNAFYTLYIFTVTVTNCNNLDSWMLFHHDSTLVGGCQLRLFHRVAVTCWTLNASLKFLLVWSLSLIYLCMLASLLVLYCQVIFLILIRSSTI